MQSEKNTGGKAHKESSSRKHNQKAPEDMSDWKCEKEISEYFEN